MKSIFAFVLLLFVTLVSCKKDNNMHSVKYTIQGTSKATITYVDANGNKQTVSNADPSWTTSFTSSNHGMLLRLTVASIDNSPIGGKIYIDGQQEAQNNASSTSIDITATLP